MIFCKCRITIEFVGAGFAVGTLAHVLLTYTVLLYAVYAVRWAYTGRIGELIHGILAHQHTTALLSAV